MLDRSHPGVRAALAAALMASVFLAACSDTGALEDDLAAVKQDAATAKAQLDSANTQVTTLGEQVATLKEQVDALQAIVNPTPVPTKGFADFGFTFPVPETLDIQVAGIGTDPASPENGQLTASAGGVSMVLIWTSDELTPEQAVQGSFEVMQASTPDLVFQAVNQGDITVDEQTGAFGAFSAFKGQETAGIGLIAGWSCGDAPTFALTVVGQDLTSVESSFNGLTSGFSCTTS